MIDFPITPVKALLLTSDHELQDLEDYLGDKSGKYHGFALYPYRPFCDEARAERHLVWPYTEELAQTAQEVTGRTKGGEMISGYEVHAIHPDALHNPMFTPKGRWRLLDELGYGFIEFFEDVQHATALTSFLEARKDEEIQSWIESMKLTMVGLSE